MSYLNFVTANLRFCMAAAPVLMLALWTASAVFGAGAELPTGDDDDTDSFGRLPPALQPGSESWDPFVGVGVQREAGFLEVSGRPPICRRQYAPGSI